MYRNGEAVRVRRYMRKAECKAAYDQMVKDHRPGVECYIDIAPDSFGYRTGYLHELGYSRNLKDAAKVLYSNVASLSLMVRGRRVNIYNIRRA